MLIEIPWFLKRLEQFNARFATEPFCSRTFAKMWSTTTGFGSTAIRGKPIFGIARVVVSIFATPVIEAEVLTRGKAR